MDDFDKRIIMDRDGWPVLLANVPNAGVVRVDPNAKSGNPGHDARSGKFGVGSSAPKKDAPPANVDPHEYSRMLAAVRDAAREFDTVDQGDIQEFLKGRAKNPDVVDIEKFMAAVRQQRVADMTDLLDQQFRSTGPLKQGRRKVRVSAPKGFLRKALGDLQPEEIKQIVDTLASRGHDQAEVQQWFKGKGFDTTTFSDQVEWDSASVVELVEEMTHRSEVTFAETLKEAIAAMPAPQVNVTVEPPPPRKLVPSRNPQTGLIESIQQENLDDAR